MTTAGVAHWQAPVSVGLVDVAGRPFPLLSARVRAHAEGGIARTLLEQSYANPYDEAFEVLYTMPLPADGSVIGYVSTIPVKSEQ